ncbi:interleukin-20 receptor subunit alpha [Misgurnus anguillicaudatus]|uniref:interleukin-20 receptor subunit alpha n=1 Tax=Misgurnus anguillicaudatus TaxID=75329 RepID=UPI003CCF454C
MDGVVVIAVCLLFGSASASGERLNEPQNVHFYSMDFRNMVRWTPGEGFSNGTSYTVEYAIYGDAEETNSEQVRWRPVKQCTFIQQTECDVSQETFNHLDEYYARVKAISPQTQSLWTESTRFSPMTDTILGPPLVEVNVVQNSIDISLKGPFRYKTKTKGGKSLWKIFPHLMYNVSVYYTKSNHTTFYSLQTSTLRLGPLEFSTHVCIVVQVQSQSLYLSSKPSERTCAETPKDVFKDQLLAAMLGGVLPSALCLCVLAVLGGLIHCYITDHKQIRPENMDVVHLSEKPQTLQPEPTVLSLFLFMGQKESKLISSVDQLPLMVEAKAPSQHMPQPCYAQQNLLVHAALDQLDVSSETEGTDVQPWPEEPQSDEAGDYGIVVRGTDEVTGLRGTEIDTYRSQGNTIEPIQTEDEDNEEEQIFLDWDPDTRELKIPLVSLLDVEDEDKTDTEKDERDEVILLPNVILRQCSEESSEQEDDFTKMERNWGLIIQSNPK